MKHACIETIALVERADLGKRTDFGADPIPVLTHKTPSLTWVPITPRGARPAYDPATHRAPQPGADTIDATSLTETWAAAVAWTAQELTDRDVAARTEVTTIVDATIAERRSAGLRDRALIQLFNKRDNYLVNRIAELQAALDAVKASTGAADNIRAAIPASWLATATRTRGEAVTDYKDNITAGGSDI